jgi:hypothetical protein
MWKVTGGDGAKIGAFCTVVVRFEITGGAARKTIDQLVTLFHNSIATRKN